MPLYEYRCEKCGRFETLQKFSAGPLLACPTCGRSVERLISAPAFQFKGSGFYITDYARAGEKGSDSKESDSKAPGSKESDSKSSETASGSSSSKEASTPPSADSKSSTNSPPKESTAPAAPALAPAATPSQ